MKNQKSVFIAVDKECYDDISTIEKRLEYNNIKVFVQKDFDKNLSLEEKWTKSLESYKLIKKCDVVYLYTKDGSIENKGIDEVCYAYACNKDLIFSEEVQHKFVNELSTRKMDLEQLIKYVTMK